LCSYLVSLVSSVQFSLKVQNLVFSSVESVMEARELDIAERINAFKTKADSLRIPASRVAAVTGYHPYAILPEIFMDLIYQGSVGHELRLQDCRELNVQLVSSDVLLMELAEKAGAETAKALESALQVKEGAKRLEDVKAAEVIKRKVLNEAEKSKKLSVDELKRLAEGTRSYVDTGFGTHHEDAALDLFEKQCGWEVRERNTSILYWSFARAENVGSPTNELTAIPLASACGKERSVRSEPRTLEGERKETMEIETAQIVKTEEKLKPFFSICGSVDGVRDELWRRPSCSTDQGSENDDEWELRQVIVECKHRMKRAYSTPPLYDQIQATAYCLMYGVDDADIIQVIRNEHPSRKRRKAKEEAVKGSMKADPRHTLLDNFLSTKNNENEPIEKAESMVPMEGTESESIAKDNHQSIQIVVSRLSVEDGIMNHRQNWQSIILPRLRSFVDAVYRVRADDDARKLFLQVVVNEELSGYATHVSWDLLHHECPWLEECDTAAKRC
jgi:hypothetical protein